jgi:hypothetical protein
MQSLNQAKEAALKYAELPESQNQALVLQKVLDLENRRTSREAAQDAGRRFVETTATIQIGRLRVLQRRASSLAIVVASLAAITALLRALSSSGGAGLNLALGILTVSAIGSGIYRVVLTERINQIQIAIEEVGRAIGNRATYASFFRVVTDGLIDLDSFREQDLSLAVELWLKELDQARRRGMVPLHPRSDPGSPNEIVSLSEIEEHSLDLGHPVPVFDTLKRCVIAGDLRYSGSAKGICFLSRDILEMASFDRGRQSVSWPDLIGEVESIEAPYGTVLERSRRSFDQGAEFAIGDSFSRNWSGDRELAEQFERLARRVGGVDLTRLLLGKGLEIGMLDEKETLDEWDNLLTIYSYALPAPSLFRKVFGNKGTYGSLRPALKAVKPPALVRGAIPDLKQGLREPVITVLK